MNTVVFVNATIGFSENIFLVYLNSVILLFCTQTQPHLPHALPSIIMTVRHSFLSRKSIMPGHLGANLVLSSIGGFPISGNARKSSDVNDT